MATMHTVPTDAGNDKQRHTHVHTYTNREHTTHSEQTVMKML